MSDIISVTRRNFLKGSTASAAALIMPSFSAKGADSISELANKSVPPYTSFMDVYRKQWTWDSVVRGTHLINCWYQSHCSFDVYVKDGVVFREEQAGDYPQTRPDLPDFNPRGCQKGACFSQRMYDPTRLTYPIRRVGERGGGQWERVSWDDALTDIADKYIDTTLEEGTDRTVWDVGAAGLSLGATHAGQGRFSQLTRCVSLDPNPNSGDGHRGAYETFGKFTMDRSVDDYFNSDLILIWGANPVYTSIPNAHFFLEAKYNGTKLIAICPDYSPSATKSDLWVPVNAGCDAALALGIAHVLVDEGHVNEDFVKEQTDFPLLVRVDTGKYLKEGDIYDTDDMENHYFIDEETGELSEAPRRSLDLDDANPTLDVDTFIKTEDGKEIHVRSVFNLLKERLSHYTPEQASQYCGTSPKLIRTLAAEMAKAKNMSNVSGSSPNKYYHGNLTERAMILLFCLLGHMGRQGAGYSAFSLLNNDGWEHFVWGLRPMERVGIYSEVGKMMVEAKIKGNTEEMVFKEIGHRSFDKIANLPIMTSGSLFWQVHGGLIEVAEDASKWVPDLKRSIKDHVEESLDKEWYPLHPAKDRTPRILIHFVSNALRRVRSSQKIIDHLWPKLKLIISIDWRMSSTTKYSDYVLPASTWYERTDHKWVTPLVPFHHVTNQATQPLGESKSDWEIVVLMAKRIQERAIARGIQTIISHDGEEVNLSTLYDDLTMDGEYTENDDEKVARVIQEKSSNLDHLDWEETKAKGYGRYSGVGKSPTSISNMGEMKDDDTFAPLTYHVRDKQPYPTDSRRIQFYLDHDLYLEYDEALPRFKEPPLIGGEYPLVMTGGHTRWSIHGAWRDNKTLLRLQRGGPLAMMSEKDAAERQVMDGDWVRVWNDVGQYEVRIKIAPSVRPGTMIMYHAWENYQFPGKNDPRQVSPTPLNPVELAGGHPHLRVGYLEGQPGGFDRDTRVQVTLLNDEEVKQLKAM